MAEKTLCFVTSAEEERPAFAIRADNDENVFIPTKIAEENDLTLGDSLQIVMIKNSKEPEKTPWYAVVVVKVD